MSSKILFIGNLCDLPYNCVHLLRENGFDAQLLVVEKTVKKSEPWIINCKPGLFGWLKRLRFMFKADVLVATAMAVNYAWLFRILGKRVIAYSMGSDFRRVYFQKDAAGWLMRRGFKVSNAIAYSNPDQTKKFAAEGFKPKFIPFTTPLDIQTKTKIHKKTVFFCPSRIDWSGPSAKDTDLFIKGFAGFLQGLPVKQRGAFELRLVEWGNDIEKARRLVEKLGLQKNVRFLQFMNYTKLLHEYSECDAVIDQFNVKSIGTAGTKAMACGKPLFVNIDKKAYKICFKKTPPIYNCINSKQVQVALKKNDKRDYSRRGADCKKWALEKHSHKLIVQRFAKLLNS